MMGKIGMHPASSNATAAGLTETVGGALLALGLATPLAAASLIGVMITAIRKVHLSHGPWNTQGGYEYNLVLIAALLGLADAGPGPLSADHALRIEKTGPGWTLAALGAGALASVATVELARRRTPPGTVPAVRPPRIRRWPPLTNNGAHQGQASHRRAFLTRRPGHSSRGALVIPYAARPGGP